MTNFTDTQKLTASTMRPWIGTIVDVEIVAVGTEQFTPQLAGGDEVLLSHGPHEDATLLRRASSATHAPPVATAVRGRTARDDEALRTVLHGNLPIVSWAARVDRDRRASAVRIHVLDHDTQW